MTLAYDVRRAVLVAVLLADPGREWSAGELAAKLHASKGSIVNDLDELTDHLPIAQGQIVRDGNEVNLYSLDAATVVSFLGLGCLRPEGTMSP